MAYRKNPASGAGLASGNNAGAADRPAEIGRDSWRKALGGLVSPAIRLHHYRNIHDRLLQDALCELDRAAHRECNA